MRLFDASAVAIEGFFADWTGSEIVLAVFSSFGLMVAGWFAIAESNRHSRVILEQEKQKAINDARANNESISSVA